MTTTDVHAHILVPDCLEAMRRVSTSGVPSLSRAGSDAYLDYGHGVRNGPLPLGMVDVGRRLEDMDRMGIELQVVSVRPQLFSYALTDVAAELASIQNQGVVAVARDNPHRINAMVTLPMQDVAASVAEVRRYASEPLVRGVLMDSHIAGRNLDDPEFEPVWRELVAADLPLLIHPFQAGVAGKERMTDYYLFNLVGNPMDSTIAVASLVFGGVLERHSDLRVGVVHGGGLAPYMVGRWDRGLQVRAEARQRTETLPSRQLEGLWFDTVVHDPRVLRVLSELVGWHRIMIGTDYPFDMGDQDPLSTVKLAGASTSILDEVAATNPLSYLRPPTAATVPTVA